MRRSKQRKSNRRQRIMGTTTQIPMSVVSLNPSEAFEKSLGQTNDSSVLRGKLIVSTQTLLVPGQILDLNPSNFGTRAANFQQTFTRFRIKGMIFRFTAVSTLAAGASASAALGIIDDASAGIPVNLSDVVEQRCSSIFLAGSTTPSTVYYTPIDKKIWYKTSRSGDVREYLPGRVFVGTTDGVSVTVEVDYSFVFAGALDFDTNP